MLLNCKGLEVTYHYHYYYNIYYCVDLLAQYQSKVVETQTVRSRIGQLQNELKAMTAGFTEAMERYKRCYKTP